MAIHAEHPEHHDDKTAEKKHLQEWWSLWLGFVMGLGFAIAVALHEREGSWFMTQSTERQPATTILEGTSHD